MSHVPENTNPPEGTNAKLNLAFAALLVTSPPEALYVKIN
jgi:hypothetical protein